MGSESKSTLGESIFSDIERSPYLNEIYEGLLYNYALKIFNIPNGISMPIDIDDALQFADILSNSVNNSRISQHKIWSQEIVAILRELYPDNPKIDVDTDLLQDQFILFLQEGDLDTGTSDQDLGLSLDTGDDEGFVR